MIINGIDVTNYTEQQFIDIWNDEHHALHHELRQLWSDEVEIEALEDEVEYGREERQNVARAEALDDGATVAAAEEAAEEAWSGVGEDFMYTNWTDEEIGLAFYNHVNKLH